MARIGLQGELPSVQELTMLLENAGTGTLRMTKTIIAKQVSDSLGNLKRSREHGKNMIIGRTKATLGCAVTHTGLLNRVA